MHLIVVNYNLDVVRMGVAVLPRSFEICVLKFTLSLIYGEVQWVHESMTNPSKMCAFCAVIQQSFQSMFRYVMTKLQVTT